MAFDFWEKGKATETQTNDTCNRKNTFAGQKQCKTLLDVLLSLLHNALLKHTFIKVAAKSLALAKSSWN